MSDPGRATGNREWAKNAAGDYQLLTTTRNYHVVRGGRLWLADGHTTTGRDHGLFIATFLTFKAARTACEADSTVPSRA